MTRPKQIIYPLSYLRAFSQGRRGAEAEFARALATYLGGNINVYPVGRARGGIFILVKLSVDGGRRRVILSPYTIPDVVNMVRFAGGEPVFVDVVPNSTNIDLDHLVTLLDDRTACVLVTHYHVIQDRLAEIRGLCRKAGVPLYDDCAIALGSRFEDGQIGGATDASVFSFSSFKTLNFFWGGAITTRRADLAKRLDEAIGAWPRLKGSQYRQQILKTLKYDIATRRFVFGSLVFPILRRKIRASDVHDVLPLSRVESTSLDETITSRPSFAALSEWLGKLALVDNLVLHRREIAKIYARYFSTSAVASETDQKIRAGSAFVNYPIIIPSGCRNAVYREILAAGFDVGLSLYPNAHETAGFTEILGRSTNVSALVRSTISLPCHPGITRDYAEKLAPAVAGAISRLGAR